MKYRGSPLYIAPEAIVYQRFASRVSMKICIANDIWSLGVSLYETITGNVPVDAKVLENLLIKLVRYDVNYSHKLLSLNEIIFFKKIFVTMNSRLDIDQFIIQLTELSDKLTPIRRNNLGSTI